MSGASDSREIHPARRRTLSGLVLATVAAVGFSGCTCEPRKQQCADQCKAAVQGCQQQADQLRQEVNSLKLKLAQALANPGTIKVDPSVLEIDGKPIGPTVHEGTLTQDQVIAVLRRSKGSLQACYTRALKRNSALRHGSITLSVSFKVKNTGQSTDILLRPQRDARMIDCMVTAIKRWTFPSFQGQPVGVESPVTLTPKE